MAASLLIADLDHALHAILDRPARWSLVRRGLRRYVLQRFPYALFYRVRPPWLEIVALAHNSRRPGYCGLSRARSLAPHHGGRYVEPLTYVEPVTPEFVAKIIERERPDALLPTVGGQTALLWGADGAPRGSIRSATSTNPRQTAWCGCSGRRRRLAPDPA